MKKVSFKLVVGALAATMMISASAVSASAISYGSDAAPATPTVITSSSTGSTVITPAAPSGPTVTNATTTTPATDSSVDSAADNGNTSTSAVVSQTTVDTAIAEAKKAGKKEATISVAESSDGKVTVQEAAIADIKAAGITVVFEVKSVSGVSYKVAIDPAKITTAKEINIGMVIATGNDLAAIASSFGVDVPGTVNALMIAPLTQGDFGMELAVTLDKSAFTGIDTANAMLFYISDSNDISDVSNQLSFDTNGNGTVAITHASAYVISDIDLVAAAAALADDEDVDFDDDDDDTAASIDEDDDDDDDKADDEPVVISGETADSNPGTGVGLALGAVVASAAAAVLAKKRK